MSERYQQIGIRVDPEFRADIKDIALAHHEGSESGAMRFGARLYIAMRRRLGPQFEPTLLALWGISLADLNATTTATPATDPKDEAA